MSMPVTFGDAAMAVFRAQDSKELQTKMARLERTMDNVASEGMAKELAYGFGARLGVGLVQTVAALGYFVFALLHTLYNLANGDGDIQEKFQHRMDQAAVHVVHGISNIAKAVPSLLAVDGEQRAVLKQDYKDRSRCLQYPQEPYVLFDKEMEIRNVE